MKSLAAFLFLKPQRSAAGRCHLRSRREKIMNRSILFVCACFIAVLPACSPRIYGTVQLVDAGMQPISVTTESPEGTVVNMINTSTSLEKASHSVVVTKEGKYESAKDAIVPGLYKVEVSRIGYMTETQSLEVKKFGGKKADFKIKKIPEGTRRSIRLKSDDDKIVNPEVNIQPPTMGVHRAKERINTEAQRHRGKI
jgi:hypothetical protein